MRLSPRFLALALCGALLAQATPAFGLASAYQIDALSFSSATTGYLAGGKDPRTGFVSVTGDRGLSWHATRFPSAWMMSVEAAGSKAWTASDYTDAIRATTTGGSAWTTISPVVGSSFVNFSGIGQFSNGALAAVGQLGSTAGGDVAVIATSANGSTWTTAFQGPLYPPPDEESPAPKTIAQLGSVDVAPSGTTAWAVGNEWTPGDGGTATFNRRLAYKTTNSGSTWTTQTIGPATYKNAATAVAVSSDNNAWVVGELRTVFRLNPNAATGTNLGYRFKSVQPAGMPLGTNFNAVDAIDDNHVVIVGDGGWVAWTSNGAADNSTADSSVWAGKQVTPAGAALRGVSMLSATEWVVVGDDETILRTTDGGATWTGSTALAPPAVAITAPAASTVLTGSQAVVSGTSTDGRGAGVAAVEVAVSREDGAYWTGTAWQAGEYWRSASTLDGWDHWTWNWDLEPGQLGEHTYTVRTRATDAFGLTGAALAGGVKVSNGTPPPTATLTVASGTDAGRPRTRVFAPAGSARVVDEIALSTTGASTTVTGIAVEARDTQPLLSQDLSSVSLYLDNGNGTYGVGDTQLGTTLAVTRLDYSQTLRFGGLSVAVAPGTPKNVWIVFRTSASGHNGDRLGSVVRTSGVSVSTGTVTAAAPIRSALGAQTLVIRARQ